uniref:Uncharacterized protein n=1 Tax=Trichogramma kaykai TaxID=54128 RepID=A0ABD2W065_9HYME
MCAIVYCRNGTRCTPCRSIRGAAYDKQCSAAVARKSYARFTLVEPRRGELGHVHIGQRDRAAAARQNFCIITFKNLFSQKL